MLRRLFLGMLMAVVFATTALADVQVKFKIVDTIVDQATAQPILNLIAGNARLGTNPTVVFT